VYHFISLQHLLSVYIFGSIYYLLSDLAAIFFCYDIFASIVVDAGVHAFADDG